MEKISRRSMFKYLPAAVGAVTVAQVSSTKSRAYVEVTCHNAEIEQELITVLKSNFEHGRVAIELDGKEIACAIVPHLPAALKARGIR